jgi:SAM-dependent methyltransferase
MAVSNYQPSYYEVSSLEEAMGKILTPEDGVSPHERWEKETPIIADMLTNRLNLSANHNIIDYGCGVGRLAKELIGSKDCNVIGVDISRSMRAFSHIYCQSDAFFSCSIKSLQTMVDIGFRADHAFAIWVLQHAEKPEEDIDLIYNALAVGSTFLVMNLDYRCLPTGNGWEDDGINIKKMIESRFDVLEYFPAPDGAVTDLARLISFCALYRKSSDSGTNIST